MYIYMYLIHHQSLWSISFMASFIANTHNQDYLINRLCVLYITVWWVRMSGTMTVLLMTVM